MTGSFECPGSIKINKGNAYCQFRRRPAKGHTRQQRNAGVSEQAFAQVDTVIDSRRCKCWPKGCKIQEQIESTVRGGDIETGLV